MSTYIVYENNGTITGTYADLASAQAGAQSLADICAAGSPTLSVQNTSTFYTCVFTLNTSRNESGIILSTSQQSINNSWLIKILNTP